jgi:hypothetical protein
LTTRKERTEAAYPNKLFNIHPGEEGMLVDPAKDGKVKKTFSFKGTNLKT